MADPAPGRRTDAEPGPVAGFDPTRRALFKKSLLGAVLLAVGGGTAIALRPTRKAKPPKEPLLVFSSAEYAIFAAIARRVIAAPAGAPSPADLDVALKADHVMALAYPSVQKEFKQLLGLFENGLVGVMTGTGLAPFTASSAKAQDARLAAWADSRLPLFRTGFQAVKRLASACYYASPESYRATGYPGPPEIGFPPELSA